MPRQVKCPRCSTINTVADGAKPICVNCGFGSPGAGYVAPASQPAGYQGQSRPPAYAPLANGPRKRPGLVTAVGVIGFIYAGVLLLAGLLLAVLGSVIAAALEQVGIPGIGALGSALFIVLGIVVAGLGVLQLFVALHIMKGKNWARIVQTVFAALGALSAIASFPNGMLGLAIDVFIIVALFLPASSAYFAASKAQAGGPYGQPVR